MPFEILNLLLLKILFLDDWKIGLWISLIYPDFAKYKMFDIFHSKSENIVSKIDRSSVKKY